MNVMLLVVCGLSRASGLYCGRLRHDPLAGQCSSPSHTRAHRISGGERTSLETFP